MHVLRCQDVSFITQIKVKLNVAEAQQRLSTRQASEREIPWHKSVIFTNRLTAIYQSASFNDKVDGNRIREATSPSRSDNLIILRKFEEEASMLPSPSLPLAIRPNDEFKCLSHERLLRRRVFPFNISLPVRIEIYLPTILNSISLYNSHIYPTTCQLKLRYKKPNPPEPPNKRGSSSSSSCLNMRNESI